MPRSESSPAAAGEGAVATTGGDSIAGEAPGLAAEVTAETTAGKGFFSSNGDLPPAGLSLLLAGCTDRSIAARSRVEAREGVGEGAGGRGK